MDSKRTVVDTVDVNNKPLKLAVIRPTNKVSTEANMAYNLRLANLMRRGSKDDSQRLLLRAELDEYLTKMGIWTTQDIIEIEKLALEIRAHELVLKKGGIKLSEGRAIALQMAKNRKTIMEKHAKRQQFDSATIESQAENFRFEFLIVKCLVFADTGVSFLKNHGDYVERQDEKAVEDGAGVLANIIYGLEDNVFHNMFEIKWLKDAQMIDSDGRYIRSDGTNIDENGHLVDRNGHYINDNGQMVDTFGRQIDEHGNLLVDVSKPFIDDKSGKEVIIGTIGKNTKKIKTKTKKKRKKKIANK